MTPKKQAHEIYNSFKEILDGFNQDDGFTHGKIIKCSIKSATLIIDEIPMYTGNLNPKWKFWCDVISELLKLQ